MFVSINMSGKDIDNKTLEQKTMLLLVLISFLIQYFFRCVRIYIFVHIWLSGKFTLYVMFITYFLYHFGFWFNQALSFL